MSKIEDVLSYGRVKILKALADSDGLTVNELVKQTGLSHYTILPHLRTLKEAGLVEAKLFGEVRLFMFSGSSRAGHVKGFFLKWKTLEVTA